MKGRFQCFRISFLLFTAIASSCMNTDYRVERVDDGKTVETPLKFDSVSGVRVGDTVTAEARFVDRADTIRINLTVHLTPSAECRAATYRAVVGGRSIEGPAACESLAFQGGQDAPAIGGVFILKNSVGSPIYRVTMPSTQMQRRFSPQ